MPMRPHALAATVASVLLLLITSALAEATVRHHRHHRRPHRAADRSCADADVPSTRLSRAVAKAAVVCLINRERTAHGLPGLRSSDRLNRSAQAWTDTMVSIRQLTHGAFWTRVTAAGVDWSQVGENIATGFSTPQQVVAGWMHSPGHCRNILDPQYATVGTGVVTRGVGTRPSTWTQDFALPMGHRAPSGNWTPANTLC